MGSRAFDLGARPVRHRVDGAPYQPGQIVQVTCSCDEQGDASGIWELVGKQKCEQWLNKVNPL
jgi:hypothetical protein